MRASRFPDPRKASPEGIVAIGGDLEVSTLVDAYSHGIFPWPQDGLPLLWFCPAERGWIDLAGELAAPSRFLRAYAKLKRETKLEVRVDTHFMQVVKACQEASRKGQDGTWILPEMLHAYADFHKAGYAHSFEVFIDGALVGGLYGVFLRGVFSGESMFHSRTDAGKIALWECLRYLKAKGCEFVDVQMVTPVVEAFGGSLVKREDYLKKLAHAQNRWDRGVCRFEWETGQLSL